MCYEATLHANSAYMGAQPQSESTLAGIWSLLMVYWRTIRIESPASFEDARPANTTPAGSSRSAIQRTYAFLWCMMFCGDALPVPEVPMLYGVTVAVAEVVGMVTFWNCPAVMIAGETVTDIVLAPVPVTVVCTTNVRADVP